MSPPTGLRIERLSSRHDTRAQLESDLVAGLAETPKRIPSKYFYDARGSRLFEEITRLPEYYLTRSELEILGEIAPSLSRAVQPREITEVGSGSSRKTRVLLEAMHEQADGDRYSPLDVSEDAIRSAAEDLLADYPWLRVHGFVGDFEQDLHALPRHGTRLVAFLGSTLGNMEEDGRVRFLSDVAAALGEDDRFLLGADLVKDPEVLEAAYDDGQGVTAEFNKNVLHVINRELGTDIPVEAFEHVARWVPEEERVEMHLRALRPVTVRVGEDGFTARLAEHEEVMTEISCKFTRRRLEQECAVAGLSLEEWHSDPADGYALAVLSSA